MPHYPATVRAQDQAHSKKFENHVHMVSLYFLYYNFCRIHRTIRCTLAMEAGITKTLHDVEWIARLVDSEYST